jgi:hypothetical protein
VYEVPESGAENEVTFSYLTFSILNMFAGNNNLVPIAILLAFVVFGCIVPIGCCVFCCAKCRQRRQEKMNALSLQQLNAVGAGAQYFQGYGAPPQQLPGSFASQNYSGAVPQYSDTSLHSIPLNIDINTASSPKMEHAAAMASATTTAQSLSDATTVNMNQA